tara:strand:+ start:250 stop:570 length:321 start_codon:yes stop_codon:yes gene_type:complete
MAHDPVALTCTSAKAETGRSKKNIMAIALVTASSSTYLGISATAIRIISVRINIAIMAIPTPTTKYQSFMGRFIYTFLTSNIYSLSYTPSYPIFGRPKTITSIQIY